MEFIDYLNEKPQEIDTGSITQDLIEYLHIYRILLQKIEGTQATSFWVNEWREINESSETSYLKLANILTDMESLRIIANKTEMNGGNFWIRLVDKSRYYSFLLEEINQAVEKIQLMQVGLIEIPALILRKSLLERIDPDLSILESWLLNGKPDDFESAVDMLFWLLGLSPVAVGSEFENVTLKSRRLKYTKSSISVDIIAQMSNDDIVLCQCSTDWKNEKVTELADICHELRDELDSKSYKVNMYPVIVTRVKKSQIQESLSYARSQGIYVFHLDTLLEMLDSVRKNKQKEQSTYFRY